MGGKYERKPQASAMLPLEVIRRKRKRLADRSAITGFFKRLTFLIVLLVLIFLVVFGVAPAPNNDMSPRISAGDLLLYYRLIDQWHIGDVLLVEQEGHTYVGRIVARGGDTVEITPQSDLVVNGSTVIEREIYYKTPPYVTGVTYPVVLQEDELFLLCDYREGGKDSRVYGAVNLRDVRGKVITVLRRSGL